MPASIDPSTFASRFFALLLCCLSLTTATATEVPGGEADPAMSLRPEQVRQLADQAKQEQGLDEKVAKQVQDLYAQALEQLDLAGQWRAKFTEYEALRLKAPELLTGLTEELGRAPSAPPEPPAADVDLGMLEQLLAEAEREQENAATELASLKAEKARRGERRLALPKLLVEVRNRLETSTEPGAETDAALPAVLVQAQQALDTARRQAGLLEVRAYEEELQSYEARGELLQARTDLADRRLAAAAEAVAGLSPILEQRRAEAAAAAVREAEREVEQAHPALQGLTRENLDLTRGKAALTESVEAARKRTAETEQLLARLEAERKRIAERVNAAGLTHAIGQFLRKQRADLPNARRLQKRIRDHKSEVAQVQTQILELEDRRADLGKLPTALAAIVQGLDPATPAGERRRIEQEAEALLRAQRETIDESLDELGSYFAELVDLDVTERRLLDEVRRFGRYIDENVLWIESASWLAPGDIQRVGEAVLWLIKPAGWLSIPVSVWGTLRASPVLGVGFILLVVILLGGRSRLRALLQPRAGRATGGASGALVNSLRQLSSVFLMALIWPTLLWLLAWLLASPYDSSEFAKGIAAGLRAAAVVLFAVGLLYRLCGDNSVGAKTFRWNKKVRHALRGELRWLFWLVVPAAFVSGVMDFQGNEAYRESLGRIAFIVAFAALAVAARRLLRPEGAVLGHLIRENAEGWLYQLRYLWYGLAVGVPAGLALAAAGGYYYTAYFLSWRLIETYWLLLGLVVFHALVQHWLKLRMHQHASAAVAAAEQAGDGMQIQLKDEELDSAAISAQAGQLLRTAVLVGAVVGGWWIWGNTLPALSVLDDVTLWSTQMEVSETVTRPDGSTSVNKLIRQVPITLADIGLALVIVVVTFVSARNIPGLLEISILDRLPFAPSVGYAITSLTKYTIVAVGLVIAFNTIGISWSKVQWLVAAMTVGLAFGLQEIFANFVSGIIILFERPIRVGDVVTVGNVSGVVSRIRIRATTITDWDRKELIVPNKRFITTEILNWTLSDAIIRVVFPVAVARGPKLEEVRAILLEIARNHALVMQDPPPSVVFSGFGPGSLRFDLRVFIRRDDYAKVLDAVNTAIEEGLAEAGIEIAAERQEIQVRPPRELPRGEKPMNFPPGNEQR